jgi:hypothetical protein
MPLDVDPNPPRETVAAALAVDPLVERDEPDEYPQKP